MLKACPFDTSAGREFESYQYPVALCIMGAKYYRTVPSGYKKPKICYSVAVDYIIKCAEAEALANILDVDVKKFVCRNIITRFGVLESLVFDNGL